MGHFPWVIAGFMHINPALGSRKDVRILQSPPNVKQSASKRKEVMELHAELLQGCWFRVNHAELFDELAPGTPALVKRPNRRSFVAGGSQNKFCGTKDKCAKALRCECKDHGVGIIEKRTSRVNINLKFSDHEQGGSQQDTIHILFSMWVYFRTRCLQCWFVQPLAFGIPTTLEGGRGAKRGQIFNLQSLH